MSGTVHTIERKRGATWALNVELHQKAADWSTADCLVQIRQTKDSPTVLASVVPTMTIAVNGEIDIAILTAVFADTVTVDLPLGKLYADLRVIRSDELGTQFPADWVIENKITVTR